jgi:acetoin utilization deacetylase AcuC-like enzyme
MHGDSRSEARMIAFTDPRFAAHAPLGFHPERPERMESAERGLARVTAPALQRAQGVPRDATRAELSCVHGERYLDKLESVLLDRGAGFLDGDTYYGPHSRKAAWLAAGSGCALVEALLADEADVGVLLARPPGHHATRDRAMGFCLLNNVAVAAAHARSLGAQRVAVVDWDVHHGNGTQDIFYRDPSVLFVSLHESPLYPDSGFAQEVGDGDARGTTVNVPLPAGSDGGAYALAFERVVLPILQQWSPDLLLISAGFDAHARDPLANMLLEDHDYRWMAGRLREVAQASAKGRVGLFLEGGYDLGALERSVEAAVLGLVAPSPRKHPRARDEASTEASLYRVVAAQRPFWKGL